MPHYLSENIALYQPEIHEFTNVLVDKMRQYDGKKPFDCLLLLRRMMVDVIFMVSYGQRLESLKSWDIVNFTEDPSSNAVEAVNLIMLRCLTRLVLPGLLWRLLNRFPPSFMKRILESDGKVTQSSRTRRVPRADP